MVHPMAGENKTPNLLQLQNIQCMEVIINNIHPIIQALTSIPFISGPSRNGPNRRGPPYTLINIH